MADRSDVTNPVVDGENDVQSQVWNALANNRNGILSGKDLYIQYGETKAAQLKTAILNLKAKDLISVKGNLDTPFGVFESVLVQK